MGTKSYGILSLTASVALGVVIGVAAATLFAPHAASIIWVTVGPLPDQLSLNPVGMDKADAVHWELNPNTKLLFIETEQKIFANSVYQQDTLRYRVACTGFVCDSGPVISVPPPAPTPPPGGYKYWQGMADPSTPTAKVWAKNGRIIIRW